MTTTLRVVNIAGALGWCALALLHFGAAFGLLNAIPVSNTEYGVASMLAAAYFATILRQQWTAHAGAR